VSIWIDPGVKIAHSKAAVIDRKVVLTRPANFTIGAAQNSENVALISSAAVDVAYTTHW
jgi:phosphatidylserine/phosphatidylglycerophosphate/cardiolipin synthase-like enzyme